MKIFNSFRIVAIKISFFVMILFGFALSPILHAGELDEAFKLLKEEKYIEAFPLFLKLANDGNPKAQGTVARMYGNGWGVEKNEHKSFFWASRGVLQDDAISQGVVGYIHANGIAGFSKNISEAVKWYTRSAQQNHLPAMRRLSEIYWELKDVDRSVFWLEKLFEAGDYSAASFLASVYGEDKPEKALEWLMRGVAKGDLLCMHQLGSAYISGEFGIAVDKLEGLRLLELSASSGSMTSLLKVATVYLNDEKVKDEKKAILWLEHGVKLGNVEAINFLATYYFFGPNHNQKSNHEKGYELLNRMRSIDGALHLVYTLESYLYSEGVDRPRNQQKSALLSLKSMRLQKEDLKNATLDAAILSGSNFKADFKGFNMPPKLALAWRRFELGSDLNGKKVEEIESFLATTKDISNVERREIERYIGFSKKMKFTEVKESENLGFQELIDQSLEYIENRRDVIGPIEPWDLIDEGWLQFLGYRGQVNEPLAQYLTEEGLRLAIRLGDKYASDIARNNLGAILTGAANKFVRNSRLGKVHIQDGKDSRFGPGNVLWYVYLEEMKVSDEEKKFLNDRFLEIEKVPHPTSQLLPLPHNLKGKSLEAAKFIEKHYKPGDKELASGIAAAYEDLENEEPDFFTANKWYEKAGHLERQKRAELILSGKYVKDMPNFTGTLNSLFEVDLVQSRGALLTNLKSAITPVSKKPINLDKSKKKLNLYALVIGNANYKDKPLKNSVNDSKAIANKLRKYGFNVIEVENVNRKKFREAVIAFTETAKNSDVTVLYYSGHGVQLGGINYLLPVDIDFSLTEEIVTYEGISLNDVHRRNLPGSTRLIFMDACRTNPFRTISRGNSTVGLAPMNVGTGTLISFATRDGTVALDGVGGSIHSPYTESLLKHLDSEEDIDLMLRLVRDDVVKATQNKQEPWKYGSLSGGKVVISRLSK